MQTVARKMDAVSVLTLLAEMAEVVKRHSSDSEGVKLEASLFELEIKSNCKTLARAEMDIINSDWEVFADDRLADLFASQAPKLF